MWWLSVLSVVLGWVWATPAPYRLLPCPACTVHLAGHLAGNPAGFVGPAVACAASPPGAARSHAQESVKKGPPLLDTGYLPFRFVRIAGTRTGRFTEFLSVPSVNYTGITAFVGVTKTGVTGVFTGSGGPTSQVVSNQGRFDGFGDWALIGNRWQVLFQGRIEQRGEGIFYWQPSRRPEVVADTLEIFTRLEGPAGMNSRGDVAFYAEIDTRLPEGYIPPERRPPVRLPERQGSERDQLPAYGDQPPEAILIQDVTGRTQVAVDTLTRFRHLEPWLALGENGMLAFVGVMRSGETGVYVQAPTGAVRAIVTNRLRYEKFGPPVLNDEGFIAFWSELKTGLQGVYLTHSMGGGIRELVLTGPEADESIDPEIGLERSGVAAYVLRRGGVPALTLRRGKGRPVILLSGNRALPEGRISDIKIGSHCLSQRGHVAFLVRFIDGSSAVYMAVPLE